MRVELNKCKIVDMKRFWIPMFTGLIVVVLYILLVSRDSDGESAYLDAIEHFNGKAQDDPKLVEYVKTQKLVPPSTKPLNIAYPTATDRSQHGQPKVVDELFHNMTDGFFVEVGAFDGEEMSNTLYFERFRNWTGLLMEANSKLFEILQTKNRKSYTIHSCISLHPVAESVNFQPLGNVGRINAAGKTTGENVQCFPFYTLMLALGRTHIDFFSLDIEGDELKVLKTIPWDKFQVTLLTVEVINVSEGKQPVIDYMKSVGYTFIKEHSFDIIFAKKDLLDKVQQQH